MAPLLVLLLSIAIVYLVFVKAMKGPRGPAVLLGTALGVILMPVVAFAGGNAAQPASPGVDWNAVVAIATALAGALGLKHYADVAKAKAIDWRDAAIALGKREARAIGLSLQKGVGNAEDAALQVLGRVQDWATKQGKNLPPPVRDAVTKGAHDVFQELHVYADQAGHEAVDKLAAAVKSFEAELPELKKKIDSFPLGTAKTASGEVSK